MKTEWLPDEATIESAVALACRAPSLHNSQPWRWVLDGNALHLYSDPDRLLPATDAFGRQLILSCGAALDHLVTAFAGVGWITDVERIPHRENPFHLAAVSFRRAAEVSDAAIRRTAAIGRRRSDRLPFAPPPQWDDVTTELRKIALESGMRLDVLPRECRPSLFAASELADRMRSHDSMYQDELTWWTGNSQLPDGIPRTALISADENSHVVVGRHFPKGQSTSGLGVISDDGAELLLLSTTYDSRYDWLRCGELLSALLLACTERNLATCTLTHVTELPQSRDVVRDTTSGNAMPQVVIRVGVPQDSDSHPRTPRRPLSEVLFVQSEEIGHL